MTGNPKFYGTHLQHKYAPVKVLHSDGVRRGITHSYFNLMHGNHISVCLELSCHRANLNANWIQLLCKFSEPLRLLQSVEGFNLSEEY